MTEESKEAVGIVGVGRMGLAIVGHLQRHGYSVVAYDVGQAQREAAQAKGARVVDSPAAMGSLVQFVLIAVGYDDEVTEVMLGDNGLLTTLKRGSVVGISSTCTPEHVRSLAAKAEEKGVSIIDAPVARGARAIDAGTMLGLVGCKPELFDKAKAIYSTFCADVAHIGDIGAGQFAKAMNNFLLWVNGIALIEAGRLTEANGVDLVKLRDALLMSSGASDALKHWENVSFIWALKDMQIVSKIADASGLSMPIAGAVKELVKDGLRIKRSNPPDWTGVRR
ncbi:MAG TPA: NAD(P)-dependent oxidoreductase [Xanthobacteraceae bacterium]|nr:NAD(P)-dependent oxidoreductase [Xanthobacteraceae bacterium]